MTTPFSPASILAVPIHGEVKHGVVKKKVLLIDTSQAKRELRAEVMRKLGMNVDCAANIAEARSWWRAALYDLVLIDMERGMGYRDEFCDDIRGATPPQRLAFLVGRPAYLASAPNGHEESPVQNAGDQINANQINDQIMGDLRVAIGAGREDLAQRWGILEASKRISAVRSASIARTQAMRALPAPLRDAEGRSSKRTPTTADLDDLLRKELQ
jgi:CheY-like chemotaxis protein